MIPLERGKETPEQRDEIQANPPGKDHSLQVELLIKGHLGDWLGDYLGDLNLKREKDGNSTITGVVPDAPAFYGLMLKLRDFGMEVLFLKAEKIMKR